MKKGQALVVSAGLSGLAMAGAAAAMHTTSLGLAAPRQATVAASALAAQQAKLDKWSAALVRARAAHPPALPAVPRFPSVRMPAAVVASRQLASAPVAPAAIDAAPRVVPATTTDAAGATPAKRGESSGTPPAPTTTTGDTTTEPTPDPATDPTTTDSAPSPPTTTVVVTVAAPPVTTGEHSDDGHSDDGHGDDGGDD